MMKLLLFLCFVAFVFEFQAMDSAGAPDINAIMRNSLFYKTAESRILIKQNLNSRVVSWDKTTLLQYFAHRDVEMVKKLLAAGARPSRKVLYSVLIHPHDGPSLETAEQLLKYNPKLANETYENNSFLLIACVGVCEPSRIAFVTLLLSYKANPNVYCANRKTPLYYLFVSELPKDHNLRIKAIKPRKRIIHELIFHGAHIKTVENSPDFLPTNIICKESVYFDLARYAERKYVFRMLKLVKKSSQDNLVKLLPDDVIKYISQKA